MSKPNIVIVLMDTLRKDAFDKWLNSYDGEYKSIIKDSFIFENAIAPSSWTLPSHVSLFTGLYPSEHGVHELYNNSKILDAIKECQEYKGKFLMDLAEENGYYTLGFSSNPVFSHSGIDSHFKNFIETKPSGLPERFTPRGFLSKEDSSKYFQLKRGIKKAKFIMKKSPLKGSVFLFDTLILNKFKDPTYKYYKNILDEFSSIVKFNSPQFIFFNFMEMHEPYVRNLDDATFQVEHTFGYKDLDKSEWSKIREVYFDQTKKITYIFEKIISKLKAEGQLDNSIFIITSDHGQALNEKGYYGHGIYNYDEISRIPLLIYASDKIIKHDKYNKNINTSLVNLYSFLKEVIIKDDLSIDKLRSDIVLCESYGIVNNVDSIISNYEDKPDFEKIKTRIDIPRKSLFKDNVKLTLNADGEIEDFNGDKEDYEELIDYFSIFNIDKFFSLPSDDLNDKN